jgi:hypothetical protein
MADGSHLQLPCHPLQCLPVPSHGPAVLQHHIISTSSGSRNGSTCELMSSSVPWVYSDVPSSGSTQITTCK